MADGDFIDGEAFELLEFGLSKAGFQAAFEQVFDAVPADLEVFGDGLDGHVSEQAEGVAFEGVREAAEGLGELDRPGAPGMRPQSRQPSRGTGNRNSTGLPPMGTVRKTRSSAPCRMTLVDWQWEQRSCLGACRRCSETMPLLLVVRRH